MRKRSTFELYGDILIAIRTDIATNSAARPTRVYGRSNVPYDRFRRYLEDMKNKGLIEIMNVDHHEELKLTSQGSEFIEEYLRVNKFLAAFGLREKQHDLE